jgi:hypothetical protein
VHHAAAVQLGDRPGEVEGDARQLAGGQRLRRAGQARAADVDEQDRARVPRRVRRLRDAGRAAQPFEDRPLVPQPARRVRAQRLLADDRAAAEPQARDARTRAGMQDLGPGCEVRVAQRPRPFGGSSTPSRSPV